jgi:glycosyltransferase involved in cell wall biosynthesis
LQRDTIICFSKDWNEDPTSNHHVLLELSRTHRVLWLNSVATRTPRLTSGRDMRKIVSKLRSFARGPERVNENLWVYTPIVLPFPHSPAARALNRHILRLTLRALRVRLGIKEFQLWSFLPNVAPYVGTLGESLAVYYCTDEWSLFSYIDKDNMVRAENELCARADVIFACCHALAEARGAINPHTYLATHGVDQSSFARALDPDTEVPEDIAGLPRPLLGFYGTIQDWVDLELIARLAQRHPEWSIVMLGGVHVDTSVVNRFGNVHLLGRKAHKDLPRYCKAFDVGLIPYRVEERMKYVNPIKLREYLSAGLPVVSTALPEVAFYGQFCAVAGDADEFEHGVIAALASDSVEKRAARSEAMKAETWEAKVAFVREKVEEARARRLARE